MQNNLGQIVLVKDINPNVNEDNYSSAPQSSNPDNFTKFSDRLYFTASDGENGNELWVSDGTSQGTNLVADINPGMSEDGYAYGSSGSEFIEFNDKLYFSAYNGETGRELWVTDGLPRDGGTTEGTNLVADINPGVRDDGYVYGSNPSNFIEFNDKLYFNAQNGENGSELWVTDGLPRDGSTTEGTNLVADINPGESTNRYVDSSNPEEFIEFNDKLYFSAVGEEIGEELWVSDGLPRDGGTTEGTSLVADINLGEGDYSYPSNRTSSYPRGFIEFNDKLYFRADDGETGSELWVSDGLPRDGGTTEGTNLVADINPSESSNGIGYGSNPQMFIEFNDKIYFSASDGETGRELWVTDGTTEGTQLAVDIRPGEDNYGSNPGEFIEFNDKLYFTLLNQDISSELWVTDGTTEGTQLVADIDPGESDEIIGFNTYLTNFIEFNDKLYFSGNNKENGNELWVTDGTTEGTQLVADIYPGSNSDGDAYDSSPDNFTIINDELFFSANNGANGRELFKLTFDEDVTNIITGNNFPNFLIGSDLADRIEGLDGKDTLDGGKGNDTLLGGDGKDILRGGAGMGDDSLVGGDGEDRLHGDNGNDILLGGDGKDFLNGGNGNDILTGGDGKDTLSGAAGDDVFTGGHGEDIFILEPNNGTDRITDFDLGGDRLGLRGLSYEDLSFSDRTINAGDEILATLDGVNTQNLTADDFEVI